MNENKCTPDQEQLIERILDNLSAEVKDKLQYKGIPEDWNGFEIRQWIADLYTSKFVDQTKLTGKRKKDYQNHILVNNLT